MGFNPRRFEGTLTITTLATWVCGYGGDINLRRSIDRVVVDNQTAADYTIYVGSNEDLVSATNGARALQLATGKGATLGGKRAKFVIHNPTAGSVTVGVIIDGGIEDNAPGGSFEFSADDDITCDMDTITCDSDRITCDATELR